LFSAVCLSGLPAQTQQLQAVPTRIGTPEERSAALKALFHEMWEDHLKRSPLFASSIGDKRYNDQMPDLSPRAYNDEIAKGREFLVRLAAIDTSGLSEQEKLSVDLMTRELVEQEQAARFKEWEYPLNQFNGIHLSLPAMSTRLTFTSEKDYDDYIARLKKIPAQIRQTSENLLAGIDDGRVLPAYLMEKVAGQIEEVATESPASSQFAEPLKRFPASIDGPTRKRITADLLAAIETEVMPAYARFGRFMRSVEVPAGRKEPGVWAMKDGDAYYAFCLRRYTTLDKTPAEIHQIGLDEVKRDEAAMLAIVKQRGFSDIKSFGTAMAADPKQHPKSKEDLLALYQHYEDQMRPRLPELFNRLPKAPLTVVDSPQFSGKDQADARYSSGSPDGSRPGRVNVNTYDPTSRLLADVEAVAYHEGLPGHHLQISIGQELTGVPDFRRFTGYTAFVEGWALYSERLGKEVGFYQDAYSDYGRLEADMWRAIRLVIDTGVHSLHWTRQQMVDYFHGHSTIDDTNINAEVDRYIAWPGQADAYKMGQMKILELRDRAQKALGSKFDLKAFHDEVIGAGALPLDVLEGRVNAWIRTQSGQKPLLPSATK
jgi:uncharacterized protein (DUF885 family)